MLTRKEIIQRLDCHFDHKYQITSLYKFNIDDITEDQFKKEINKVICPDDIIVCKDVTLSRSGTTFRIIKHNKVFNIVMKPKSIVLKGFNNNEQEIGFLIILNALFNKKTNNITLDDCFNYCNFKTIYDGDVLLSDDLISKTELFLKHKPSWFNSLKHQAIKFKKTVPIKPKRYIKDNKFYKINLFAKCELGFSRKDKWNPSDVWLSYDNITSDDILKKYNTGKKLNQFLYDSIEYNNGLIGISLKGSNTNNNEISISKMSSIENSISSPSGFIPTFGQRGLFGGALTKKLRLIAHENLFNVDIRQFQNKPTQHLQSEISIPYSRGMGGKSNLNKYFEIKRDYKIESKVKNVDFINKFRESFYFDKFKINSYGEYCFYKSLESFENIKQNIVGNTIFNKFISIKDLLNRCSDYDYKFDNFTYDINSILISQCMEIIFLEDILSIKGNKKRMYVLTEWVNHAMGTTKFSARHYKVD